MVKWKNEKLQNLMRIQTGSKNTENNKVNGKYPFFVRSQQIERIDSYSYDCEAVLTAGDGVGTGKVFHYINSKFDVHQRVYVMSNFTGIDGKFFYYFFSENFLGEVHKFTAKSSVDSVRRAMIAEMEISLPPLPEQRAIATALSDVDGYIAALERLIAKKRDIQEGAMQELLTGKRRLPGFSGKWVEKRMGNIGYTYSGLTGKRKEHFGVGDSKYITFLNVLMNTVIETAILEHVTVGENEQQNFVKCGDLFFNTSSETPEEVGMCAVLTKPLKNTYLNSFCFGYRLTDSSIDGLYLSYFFNSSEGRKIMSLLAQGATRYNLPKSYFNEICLMLPTKDEQTAIAAILSDMDAEIDALTIKLAKVQDIKQGMMQELLTGRIRLVNEAEKKKVTSALNSVTKVIPFKSKNTEAAKSIKNASTKVQKAVGHNTPIEDAVILAAVTERYATEQYPLAPFYAQKFSYLLHRHMEGIAKGYIKKAAGPYKPALKYKTALPIALKNRYVDPHKATYQGQSFVNLTVGDNIVEAKNYFAQWHGDEPLKWLEQFRYIKNRRDELELLTTVDMAMIELRNTHKPITILAIKEIIKNSEEWKAKLKRELFSDDNIKRAVKWSNELFGTEVNQQ